MSGSIVLASARRTPFGRFLGGLSEVDPLTLAETAARAALAQAKLEPGPDVERLFVGNCMPSAFATGSTVGRQIGLALGLEGFAVTIDTACCSPLTALRMAWQSLVLGDAEVALIVGVESMSNVPHIARGLRRGRRAGALELVDPIFPITYEGYAPVAVDAASGAERYGVNREEMDAWALRSQQRWAAADEAGRFADELVPVTVEGRRGASCVERDEQPRRDTTLEALAALPGVFGTSTITAGNAPGLNDGAAAAVVMTAERARALGVEPLAEIAAAEGCTAAPDGIAWVPALAVAGALEQAAIGVDEPVCLEINEAFAAMPLVSTRVLAEGDESRSDLLRRITNVNGGAVAMGHPVGASGLRILGALAYELRRRGGGWGAAAICGGLAQGEAVVLRV